MSTAPAPLDTPAAPDPTRWRLTVTADDMPQGPIERGRLTVLSTRALLGGREDSTPTGGTDPIGLARAARWMTGADLTHGGVSIPPGMLSTRDDERIVAAMIRWARVFHGVTVARWRATGYAQGDYADGLAYLEDAADRAETLDAQADMLTGELDTAAQAWRGDVYVVTLETRMTWHASELADIPEGTPRTRDTWERVDSIGGIYLTDDYTAADVAREYLNAPAGLDLDAVDVVTAW